MSPASALGLSHAAGRHQGMEAVRALSGYSVGTRSYSVGTPPSTRVLTRYGFGCSRGTLTGLALGLCASVHVRDGPRAVPRADQKLSGTRRRQTMAKIETTEANYQTSFLICLCSEQWRCMHRRVQLPHGRLATLVTLCRCCRWCFRNHKLDWSTSRLLGGCSRSGSGFQRDSQL